MGFVPTALWLLPSPKPDAAMEYLEKNLARIAAGRGVEVRSYVAMARENKMAYGILIAARAILLLFLPSAPAPTTPSGIDPAGARSARSGGGRLERVITAPTWRLLSTFTWGTVAGLAVELALCGWLL